MNSLFMVIMQLHTYADATQYTQSIFSFRTGKTQMSQIRLSEIINNPVLLRPQCSRKVRYSSFIAQDFFHFSSFINNWDNLNL